MLKIKIAAVLVVSLMTFSGFAIMVDSDNNDATNTGTILYGMGNNGTGQQGNGISSGPPVDTPTQIGSTLGTITKVVCSPYTTFFLTSDGKLYGTGLNEKGQIGNGTSGTNNMVDVPTQIGSDLGTIIDVAYPSNSMDNATFFLTSDGKLYGTGDNTFGQQGDGTTTMVTTPTQIGSDLGTITKVACAEFTTFFLTSDGKLYGMGNNGTGQLGLGDTVADSKTPTQIGSDLGTITDVTCSAQKTLFLTSDGKLYGMGQYKGNQPVFTPTQIGSDLGTITKVVCSPGTTPGATFFLTSDGKLYGIGTNPYGQIGNNSTSVVTTPTQIGSDLGTITDVVCSEFTTFFLTSDGKLYGMGDNKYGQQGNGSSGTGAKVLIPTQIGSDLGTITDVACSDSTSAGTTFFLTSDGKLYGMGKNDSAQMGDGTTTDVTTPTQIGSDLGTITDVICSTKTTFLFVSAGTTIEIESNNEYGSVDISELEIDDPDEAIVVSGDTLTYGSTVVTATSAADTAQYDYSFVGWYNGSTLIPDGEFAVTESMTITAVFSADLNQYTVSFVSSNPNYGSVSPSSLVVDYGTSIVLEGSDLTIGETTVVAAPAVSNAQYSYVFSHWTVPDSAGSVTGDITVTGTFTSSVNTYTVSFVSTDYSLGVVYPSVITGVPYGSVVTVEGDSVFIDDVEVTAIATDENLRARMSVSTGYEIVDDIEVSVSFEEPSALDKFFESVGSSEMVMVSVLAASILSMVFFIRRR